MVTRQKNIKAVALLSGGLDSRLAVRIVKEQGIEIIILSFVSAFCTCTVKGSCRLEAQKAAEEMGLEAKVINSTLDFLEIIKKPKHGYGSGMNPCIDCRILMFKKAREYMDQVGAFFLVTGEVLGQRPMSQHLNSMRLIEKEAGLEGLILRPLSAKLLKESIPEQKGWVDRAKLMAIKGRSRKPQFALAELLEIKDFPCPAGGCLLTGKEFAGKVKDLVVHDGLIMSNVLLLKTGRHFRLDKRTKVIVSRDEQENEKLLSLAKEGDLLFELNEKAGPLVLLRGETRNGNRKIAAGLAIYYSKFKDSENEEVKVFNRETAAEIMRARPAVRSFVDQVKI
ncbi:hypothetical protein A3H38_03540 [candidate division WOR-1 bacterium RIFCSPLOWO2_02_FULL_46_20]|uniref:Uncharacterized protein n=2 Tax=Saganbacteria TaxID=1703751 RepID=A0A1F4RG06_UNCSA|nr:MAG: hypothetical protein A3H38_03540 [candidate division WOR-1 bacterium RIFCSPLOWO2_02_FULL_46_20]OGC07969.1 MAG: hypothetical protein A3F86_05885 [candidate division WOR-1 bacterium RIFCSPLOWO2_12_FULL_45_9]